MRERLQVSLVKGKRYLRSRYDDRGIYMPTGKGSEKFHTVMTEFESGKLTSSSGDKVTSKKQALAIAYSEARKINPNYGKKSTLTGQGH